MYKFQTTENTISHYPHRGTGSGVFLYRVAVLEPPSGKVTPLMRDWLIRRGAGPPAVLTREARLAAFSGVYDLFLVTSAIGEPAERERPRDLRCRVLLAPSDGQRETLEIPSQWVMSYGFAVRDSLTVSSLEPDQAVLALQRELVTLDGAVLERQELPLPIPPGIGAQGVMALYGSLLALGVAPEALVLQDAPRVSWPRPGHIDS